jgi:glycosyltransferase involved in cell wall biosynthesis
VGKGPYEKELQNIAKNTGVTEKIEWLKDLSRKELLECYADADLFLMLSSHESYGITVAEALATGIPCIVAKGSALDEFVDGINCIGIEKPLTKEKVIKALKGLKEAEKQKKSDKVKGLIDWKDVVDKIVEIYVK